MPYAYRPRRPSKAAHAFAHAAYHPEAPIPVPPRARPKGADSNWARGTKAERWARAQLVRDGYWLAPNPESLGAADIIALANDITHVPAVRAVQVKMCTADTYKPSCLNDAVRDLLNHAVNGKTRRNPLPATARREAWLVLEDGDTHTLIARCVITTNDTLTVDGPKQNEVTKALDAMLARGERTTNRRSRLTLEERLQA